MLSEADMRDTTLDDIEIRINNVFLVRDSSEPEDVPESWEPHRIRYIQALEEARDFCKAYNSSLAQNFDAEPVSLVAIKNLKRVAAPKQHGEHKSSAMAPTTNPPVVAPRQANMTASPRTEKLRAKADSGASLQESDLSTLKTPTTDKKRPRDAETSLERPTPPRTSDTDTPGKDFEEMLRKQYDFLSKLIPKAKRSKKDLLSLEKSCSAVRADLLQLQQKLRRV
jgi:hypothetical protein